MSKFFNPLFLLCFFLGKNCLVAQVAEKQLFEGICQNIEKQNSYYLIKQRLSGTTLVEDPITGKQSIKYGDDTKSLIDFKKISLNEQIEILNSNDLPVFPLQDTTFVIDALGFFSEGLSCKSGKYFFKIVSKTEKRNVVKYLSLHAVGIRGDYLILSFSFPKGKYLNNFYYKIEGDRYKMVKSSLVVATPSFE